MKQVNLGLLGAGFLQDFHMQAYREIPEAKIVAVASRTRESASSFASKWGIERFFHGEAAIQELCECKDIDAVSIGIPNHLHQEAAILAAENSKHVICEKPLGRTAKEARSMLDAVQKAGVIHCYAENQVFFPLHTHAFKLIQEEALGDVYWVRSREAHGGPHADHFWDINRAGGGVGMDMGCHSIEVARKAFGNDAPVEVLMWGDTLVHEERTSGEDNCIILVKYKHGQMGQAENSWSTRAGLDLRTEIHGKAGAIFMDNTRETGLKVFTTANVDYVVEKGESGTGWMFPVPNEYMVYGYFHELRHFTSCMINDMAPIETFEDGLMVNKILDAAYRSLESKRWESIE